MRSARGMVFGEREKVSGQTLQEQHDLDLERERWDSANKMAKESPMSRVGEAGS